MHRVKTAKRAILVAAILGIASAVAAGAIGWACISSLTTRQRLANPSRTGGKLPIPSFGDRSIRTRAS
jgi:hypothetical protein